MYKFPRSESVRQLSGQTFELNVSPDLVRTGRALHCDFCLGGKGDFIVLEGFRIRDIIGSFVP